MQYFHDKAISKEINYATITCPYCNNWSGEYRHYQVSDISCSYYLIHRDKLYLAEH